jgi:hypothetical protein
MKFNKFDPYIQDKSQYKLLQEKTTIDKIRAALNNEMKQRLMSKPYIDPKYNFRVVFPYLNELNNVVTRQDDKIGYIATTMLPGTTLPFEFQGDSMISLQIINNSFISKNLEYLKSRLASHKLFFTDVGPLSGINNNQSTNLTQESNTFQEFVPNYRILNSSDFYLKDGSLAAVDEITYFSPLHRQMIIEKRLETIDDGRFVSISLLAVPSEYDLYEPEFDKTVRSFEFIPS